MTSRYNAYKPRFEYQRSNVAKQTATLLLAMIVLIVAIQGTVNYIKVTPEGKPWITEYLDVSGRWAAISQVALPIVLTLSLFGYFMLWTRRLTNKGLPSQLMEFCYAVINAEKLESLKSLPDESIHIRNEIKYIKKHFPHTVDSLIKLSYPFHENDLIAVYNGIQKDTPWAKFDQQSDEIICSFVGIREEVYVRLDQRIDFDVLSPIFRLIPKLQLCQNKPNIKIDDNVTLRSKEIELLNEFKRHVQSLPEMSPDPITQSVKWSQRVGNLFTKSNVITMMSCWLLLLAVGFLVLYASLFWILNIKDDTTPQVAATISAGIVASAIALALYFHKVNRGHE